MRLLISFVLALQFLAPAQASGQTITVDGTTGGRVFDGIGALSAGASSRLLIDYPEPSRARILDYLFKPSYGAALQILKVEIGGDTNSTDGAEPSHQRVPGELNCRRGYEWWLIDEARKRNPRIIVSALQWGAPHWTGNFAPARPTPWTDQNIDYLINWLDCAKQRGHRVDYLGGWNEGGWDAAWYQRLRKQLDGRGYQDVKVIADDGFNNWGVVRDLAADQGFRDSVDVIANHYVCGYLGQERDCSSPPEAVAMGKPIHASEQGSLPYDSGAQPMARAHNREYLDASITSTVNWSLIASWYDTMPFQGTGLMGANEPWSGAYVPGPSLWATAHTTQFTAPGWRYLDSAKGRLDGGGSYVAYRAEQGGDYSTVVETLDADRPQEVTFEVNGGLSAGPVNVWESDLRSKDPGRWFVRTGSLDPAGGRYTVTLQPGRVYTLSTTGGQGKGEAASPGAAPLRLPYRESFDHYGAGQTPRYLSDLDGAFETARCAGRAGLCLEQQITEQPMWWNGWLKKPLTLVGDLKSWRDYAVSVDSRLDGDGWTELLGRVDGQFGGAVSGVHLRLSGGGEWRLYEERLTGQNALCGGRSRQCLRTAAPPAERTLTSGRVEGLAPAGWHRLRLDFRGSDVTASIDGRRVATAAVPARAGGQVGLGVSPWRKAQFDNLRVDPVAPVSDLRFLPGQRLRAEATDFHRGYEARQAVDGSVQSMWHTSWDPHLALPQAITVDLGAPERVGKFTYQPRTDGQSNGIITRYTLEAGQDGSTFTPVASGDWPANADRKEISLPGIRARYLRLTAVAAGGNYASAAELGVAVYR